jgi:hypothetical protein
LVLQGEGLVALALVAGGEPLKFAAEFGMQV